MCDSTHLFQFPIVHCTLTTNVQYKTEVTVLNVPVYLFGHCWYKAYLVLHAY